MVGLRCCAAMPFKAANLIDPVNPVHHVKIMVPDTSRWLARNAVAGNRDWPRRKASAATNSYWRSTNYWDVETWNQLFFRMQSQ
jgi:hypothetical protein